MKDSNINIRVNQSTKAQAEEIFASFGLTISDAVNIFLHKSIMESGLPFDVRQTRYNAETENAMDEAEKIAANPKQTKSHSTAQDLFKK